MEGLKVGKPLAQITEMNDQERREMKMRHEKKQAGRNTTYRQVVGTSGAWCCGELTPVLLAGESNYDET